jgi:hypothetical protein
MSLFVAANILGLFIFAPLFFQIPWVWQAISMGLLFLMAVSGLFIFFRKKAVFFLMILAVLSYSINNFQITMIAHAFGVPFSFHFFRTVIVAEIARVISHVPLGLGVTDGIFYAHFQNDTALLNFPLFLVAVRMLGELLTAFWGILVFFFEMLTERSVHGERC